MASTSPDRRHLMQSAMSFLRDPNTQASTFAQRIQFLEAKGMTPHEIEEAMRQVMVAQNQSSQVASYGAYPQYGNPQYAAVPQRQALDWRDYFIMAVVSGTFMYGAVSLARKYLLPHLKPPSSTVYEEDRDALTAQFDAAEQLLKEIQAETQAVREAVEAQKQKVDQTTEDVQAVVKEMHEGEVKNRDEMREIREEINSIREMLPKMIEKNKESHNHSLAELQQELKSLKALLLSRGPSFPSSASPTPGLPSFVGRPSIPSWQLSSAGTSNVVNPAGLDGLNGTGSMSPIPTPIPTRSTPADFPGHDVSVTFSNASSSSNTINADPASQPESL